MLCGSLYALFAGFLGAAASLSAKLSLGPAYLQEMCDSALRGWSEGASVCGWVLRTNVFPVKDWSSFPAMGGVSWLDLLQKLAETLFIPLNNVLTWCSCNHVTETKTGINGEAPICYGLKRRILNTRGTHFD
nr:uncharacterized protein LOC107375655 isoform X2 [Nothobranchius furzeri]